MKYRPHRAVKRVIAQHIFRFFSYGRLACTTGLLHMALVLAGISISHVAVGSQMLEPPLRMASSRIGTSSLDPILNADNTLVSTNASPGLISTNTSWTMNDSMLIDRRFDRNLRALLTGDSSLEGEGMVRWSGGIPVKLWRVSQDPQRLNPDEDAVNEENSLLSGSTAAMYGFMEGATHSWSDKTPEESDSGARIEFSHVDSLVEQGSDRPVALNWTVDVATIEVPGIPEPGVVWFWVLAALGTGMWRWRKRITR